MAASGRFISTLTLLCGSVLVSASAFQDPPPKVFSSRSEVVVLHVAVLDGKHRLVAGLPRESFTVFEDGQAEPVSFFHNEDNPVTVGDNFRTIQTDLAVQKAVAWSAETRLLVGGAPIKDKNALFEITINGAGQEPVPPEGTGNYSIEVLSVRPASPTGSPQLAMLDANGTAFRVWAAEIQPLKLGGSSPAPSPSTSAGTVEQHLTAPFFLD